MRRSCDQPGEMPEQFPASEDFLDDESIEAILCGRRPAEPGFESLVTFASDVHAVAEQPAPRPNASLAAVLASGLSTEKGDLLVTAASNVTGPATKQAAGLPKWRKRHSMLPTGLFSGLVAKVVAGVVAGLAGVTAVGAAGALPGPAQHAVANVINTVTPFNLPTGDSSVSITAGANPTPGASAGVTAGGADANASASTSGASASAGTTAPTTAGATATANASLPTPTVPTIPGLSGLPGLSALPGLNNLPVQIPACVKDIIDLKTGQPKIPLNQISTQVIACVRSLMSMSATSLPTGQLPAGLSQCVNSILGMLGSVGTNPGAVPNITGVDFTKCVPIDVTKCMTSIMSMFSRFIPGGFFGFGGSAGTSGGTATATGGFSIPGLSGLDLSGCLPFSLDACLNSLLSMAGNLPGVATGGIPGLGASALPGNLNLSACVPFGSLNTIPGMNWLSAFLPH